MNISGIGLHAHNGIKLIVLLLPTATAIRICDSTDALGIGETAIFLPVADYDRAQRACAIFNDIMAEAQEVPLEEHVNPSPITPRIVEAAE